MAQGIEAFFYYPTNRSMWDAVSGKFCTVTTGSPSRVATSNGIAQYLVSARSTLTARNPLSKTTNDVTIICRYRMKTLPANRANVFMYSNSTQTRAVSIGATSTQGHASGLYGSNGLVFSSSGTSSSELDVFHTIGAEHGETGDSSIYTWLDGVALGLTFPGAGVTGGATMGLLTVGGDSSNYFNNPDVEILWAAAFNRRLTDAEHAWWHRNAFAVLEGRALGRAAKYGVASGGGLTLLKIIDETDQSAEASQTPRVQVRPVNESVSVSEALQAVRAIVRMVAETETTSSLELITRAIILLRDETVQIAESASNVRGLAQVVAETQQSAEAAQRLLTLLRQTGESSSTAEATQRLRDLARVLAETVNVTEGSIAARVMARIAGETSATAENTQITKAFAQVVAESLAPTEGSVIALGRVREIAETIQAAEALIVLLAKVLQRDETSQIAEAPLTLRTLLRLIAETEADSEALIKLATYVRVANETGATAESSIAARVLLRLVAETEQISELSIRSFVITAALGALLMTARCLSWLGMTGTAEPTLTVETDVKPTTE